MCCSNADYDANMALRSPVVHTAPSDWRRRKSTTEADLDPTYNMREDEDGLRSPTFPTYDRWYYKIRYYQNAATSLLILALAFGIPYYYTHKSMADDSSNNVVPLLKPGDSVTPFAKPVVDHPRGRYKLNFTEEMDPFWSGYGDILTNTEYATWFADVDNATEVINTMWGAMPQPTDKEYQSYTKAKQAVEARATALQTAKQEFEEFLAARTRVVRDVIGTSTLCKVYVDGRLATKDAGNNNAEAKKLIAIAKQCEEPLVASSSSQKPLAEYDDSTQAALTQAALTQAALTQAAQRITRELVRAHYDLWKAEDVAVESAARFDVLVAEKHEVSALRVLRAKSARADEWRTGAHKTSMAKLRRRMDALRRQHADMKAGLDWLKTRLAKDLQADQNNNKRELRRLSQSAMELLTTWATVLMDTQEGVLFALREKELEGRDPATVDFDASWGAWKQRNCGATSCFDEAGLLHSIKGVFVRGKPTAHVAQDEAEWNKEFGGQETTEVKVWNGVYDKACCEDGKLAHMLKYGSKAGQA